MTEQEREHWDYEDGCQSEFQNAFSRSRSEIQLVNDTSKAEELTSQGKFVVMYEREVHCPCTDASIGFDIMIIGVFDTENEAKGSLDIDSFIYKKRKERIMDYVPSDESLPF